MKVLARTNDYHDLYLDSSGQIAMVESKVCHAQIIESVILTVSGEIQLNTNKGIPYFTTVFESRMYLKSWKTAVENAVSKLDFVSLIEEFNCRFLDDTLYYDMTVFTNDGERVIVNDTINTSLTTPIYPNGDEGMADLTDANGNFYMPEKKVSGVQYYRRMTIITDGTYGDTTQLSSDSYIKDSSGNFVVAEIR
jgi:hypothetical protein